MLNLVDFVEGQKSQLQIKSQELFTQKWSSPVSMASNEDSLDGAKAENEHEVLCF